MTTGGRLIREIEDLDATLRRIVEDIDGGRANFTDVRRALERIRLSDLPELDRIARRVKRQLRD